MAECLSAKLINPAKDGQKNGTTHFFSALKNNDVLFFQRDRKNSKSF